MSKVLFTGAGHPVHSANKYSKTEFAFCELLATFAMKVHLIKEQIILDFCKLHLDATASFADWLAKIRRADWDSSADIRHTFRSADLLGKGSQRVVFNIGGNKYRMICRYKFAGMVHLSVKWIGTHAEYNKLCGVHKNRKKSVQDSDQYTVNLY